MARMHSRRKGKSGSNRPEENKKQSWQRYGVKEIESLVVKIAKTDKRASQIGMILRDSYGVPDVKTATSKKITQILTDNKIKQELPENLVYLIKKYIKVSEHFETNKQDMTAKRGLQLTESKINRMVKYYKANKKIPKEWKFEREKAKLLIN